MPFSMCKDCIRNKGKEGCTREWTCTHLCKDTPDEVQDIVIERVEMTEWCFGCTVRLTIDKWSIVEMDECTSGRVDERLNMVKDASGMHRENVIKVIKS